MIIKIVSLLIIVVVSYGASAFLLPDLTSRIDSIIGVPGLSESIRGSKDTLDFVSTDGVNSTLESVRQARQNAQEVVDTTKDRIDTVREQAANLEQSVQEIQGNIDTLKEVYETTTENIEQVSNTVRNFSGGVQSGSTSQ